MCYPTIVEHQKTKPKFSLSTTEKLIALLCRQAAVLKPIKLENLRVYLLPNNSHCS